MMGSLVFLNPWILGGLIALPVLWWLLKITPPSPRLIVLPTTRFLAGLIPEKQTPSHTPWWILLLRLLIAAFVIIALAGPVYNPSAQLGASGPLRLVIDNSWASAQVWDDESNTALQLLAEAARANKDIYILTTAPVAGEQRPFTQGPVSATQAESIVKGLKPLPWAAEYSTLTEMLEDAPGPDRIDTVWLSNGLADDSHSGLMDKLKKQGSVSLMMPRAERLPLLLRPPEKNEQGKLQMTIAAPDAMPSGRPVSLQALDDNGQIIDQSSVTMKAGINAVVTFDTPETLRGDISQLRLSGANGVGGIYILDERFKKRSVGLIGPTGDTNAKPFIEARYYLERAVEPFTTLSEGTAEEVLKSEPSVIILPDVATLAPETLNALENWVKGGGVLIRFAGPNMAQEQGESFLTPTPLRKGGRSLDGSLTWEKPQKIVPFPETSPLRGIALHEDIVVRQQVLAQPVPDLDEKTWATLEDGTPLSTAAPLDKGLFIMMHTSADPSWSDLPLSGSFVDILKRIVSLSGHAQSFKNQDNGRLDPLQVFDGFGQLRTPDSSVQPIMATDFDATTPSSKNPPGLYGRPGLEMALNLGDHLQSLRTPAASSGVTVKNYGQDYELDLLPYILYTALALLFVDWTIMIVMVGNFRSLARFAGLSVLLFTLPANAAPSENDLKYADGLYLAYIQTGDPAVDALSRQGLENLAGVLKRRTSVEPDGVVPLDAETGTLIFFPFLYWPISQSQGEMSELALQNIQHYLDHGGTILFDTRDGASEGFNTPNGAHLRNLVARLSIPALAPISKDHVLSKSFYLLASFPGRLTSGTLWVETQSVSGRDNVSSVIIGANDWAGAWSEGGANIVSGATRQQEMALRFGVNVTMYALTGNYKADQVHVKNILERLGQ